MKTAFPTGKLRQTRGWILLSLMVARAVVALPETNNPPGNTSWGPRVGEALRAIYRNPKNASNVVQSVQVIRSAAEKGSALAQYDLAVCYDAGLGVPHDEKQAIVFYEKAAQNGLAAAQFDLALSYLNGGQGVEQNPGLGVEWLRKAAESGHPGAQNQMGACYAMGVGVSQNEATAFSWYEKAANQNHPKALFNLGYCYLVGQGVRVDRNQAVEYLRRSADRGLLRAQYRLALLFFQGVEVPRDDLQAYEYALRASRGPNPLAARLRNQIAANLTPEQTNEVQKKYQAWLNR